MADELTGKVIVLTGGADGIGRECASAYGREGATVAIVDRDLDAAKRTAAELGGGSIALGADVSDGEAVRSAIAAVVSQFGRIDAVHNNAGIASPSKPLHETTEQEWDNLQRTNVKSVYWTTRFAFEALAASHGCILNTASMVGLIGQTDHAAYVASKGAMISLTKAMAAIRSGSTRSVRLAYGHRCWSGGALSSRNRAVSADIWTRSTRWAIARAVM